MNEIKLNKIETLQGGVKFAHINLKIKSFNTCIDFDLISTGTIIRVESSHLVGELSILIEWLRKPSENKDNSRTNESEIIMFALDMFEANNKLNETFEL